MHYSNELYYWFKLVLSGFRKSNISGNSRNWFFGCNLYLKINSIHRKKVKHVSVRSLFHQCSKSVFPGILLNWFNAKTLETDRRHAKLV